MERSTWTAALRRLALPATLAAVLALALWLAAGAGLPGRPMLAQPAAGTHTGAHTDLHMMTHTAEHSGTSGDAAALHAALAAADVVVELSGFTFSPTVVTITPGQTVTWVRRSGFHNVAADDGSYRSGAVSDTWQTFSHTFTAVGESLYHCEAHGSVGGVGMAGKVVVQVSGQTERKLYLPALAPPAGVTMGTAIQPRRAGVPVPPCRIIPRTSANLRSVLSIVGNPIAQLGVSPRTAGHVHGVEGVEDVAAGIGDIAGNVDDIFGNAGQLAGNGTLLTLAGHTHCRLKTYNIFVMLRRQTELLGRHAGPYLKPLHAAHAGINIFGAIDIGRDAHLCPIPCRKEFEPLDDKPGFAAGRPGRRTRRRLRQCQVLRDKDPLAQGYAAPLRRPRQPVPPCGRCVLPTQSVQTPCRRSWLRRRWQPGPRPGQSAPSA